MSIFGGWWDMTYYDHGGLLWNSDNQNQNWTDKAALDELKRLCEKICVIIRNYIEKQSPRTFQLGNVNYSKYDRAGTGGQQVELDPKEYAFMVMSVHILPGDAPEPPSLSSVVSVFRREIRGHLRQLGILKNKNVDILDGRVLLTTDKGYFMAIQPVL